MNQMETLDPFDERIRKVWDEGKNEWWYAVVDVIEVLTETQIPSRYWNDMRKRAKKLFTLIAEVIIV
jgi:hypothetical protein